MNHVKRIEICNENKCKAGQYIIASSALYAYLCGMTLRWKTYEEQKETQGKIWNNTKYGLKTTHCYHEL